MRNLQVEVPVFVLQSLWFLVDVSRWKLYVMCLRLQILNVQAMKGEPVSLSSDVFSYGMLLYEILTGELPFADAKSDVLVGSKIMSGEVRMVMYFLHTEIA